MYVIDASIHVPHHSEARAFLDHVRGTDKLAYGPVIVLAEVAGGIARGTDRPGLARRLIGLLQRVPNFVFVPVDETLGQLAAEVAAERQIRGCDSVYVALAGQLGATLVTLDGEQRQRAPASVIAQTPAEALSVIAARNADPSGHSH